MSILLASSNKQTLTDYVIISIKGDFPPYISC